MNDRERMEQARARREVAAELRKLLDELAAALKRWVAWPSPHFPRVVALWIAHTHLMEAFETTPRLAVLSPVKGSGKTRVLELLEVSSAGPMFAVNLSASVLFRRLDKGGSTLLLDEADTHLGGMGKGSDKYEDLRGIVNAGYRVGAKAYRSEPTGKAIVEREFNVFAPVAIAGIGDLPDTVLDRSIIVPMRRRAASERVDRYRVRDGKHVLGPLHDALAAKADLLVEALTDARPFLPDTIEDRAADCWEPLLAVAELAEGDWPKWAREAAVEVNKLRTERAPSLGELLLGDIRRVFGDRDRMSTAALVEALTRLDESPWASLSGKPLDARGLTRRLRRFGVTSGTIRVGDSTPRGYYREAFEDAWERYLPSLSTAQEPQQAQQAQQTQQEPAQTSLLDEHRVADVSDVADVAGSGAWRETPADPCGHPESDLDPTGACTACGAQVIDF